MILALQKDSEGKFAPATKEEIAAALAVKDGALKKHNEPNNPQSVLLTTLQEADKATDMKLEDIGL